MLTTIIDQFFALALVINSVIFFIQLIKIIRHRSARDISLFAFLGFAAIQLITILHGYLHRDNYLFYGTQISLFACLCLIGAIIYFRYEESRQIKKNHHIDMVEPGLEQIISLIPANVYWINREGIFLGCNNQMLNTLNLKSIDEYRGKTYADLYEKKHIAIIQETDEKVMQTNTAITLEEVAVPYKVYLTNKIPLHDKRGQVIGLLGVSVDITNKKEAERALALATKKAEVANLAKTEFLYNMRHDIRTPLSNILGLSKIAFDMESNEDKKTLFKNIVISSDSLMELLNELLEFSNIDEGIYPIKTQRFNLEEMILKIQSIMSAAIHHKGLHFIIDYPADLPKIILGDAMRTHRILLNLVSNAIKYTHSGGITLSVELYEETTRNYYIKIMVKDTGIGVPADKLDFIFGKFNKLTPSYMSNDTGTGLGLSIAKEFVQDLDGEIYVDSQQNQGSLFTCIIPYFKPLDSFICKPTNGDETHGKVKKEFVDRR